MPMINTNKLKRYFFIFDLFIVTLISLLFYINNKITTPRVIYIPNGSISHIVSYLDNKKHYNLSKLDSYLLRVIGQPQGGWIDLKSNTLTRADFLYKLTVSKAAMKDITLIPGETLYFFFLHIQDILGLDPIKLFEEYYKVAPLQDGLILPNTYKMPIGITEYRLIYNLLQESMKKHKFLAKKFFGKYDEKKWFKYLSIASVIQKEAGSVEEMPYVSAVVFNRLKKGMRLQMDGTLNYGRYSHTRVTPKMIKEDKTSFNTYKYYGVPSSPAGAVSLDAISAAIYPASSNALYFMKSKSGKHIFTNSYKAHRKIINRVKRR